MRSDDLALLTTDQMLEELARRHRTAVILIAGVGRRNDGRSNYRVAYAGLSMEAMGLLTFAADQIAQAVAGEMEAPAPDDGQQTQET